MIGAGRSHWPMQETRLILLGFVSNARAGMRTHEFWPPGLSPHPAPGCRQLDSAAKGLITFDMLFSLVIADSDCSVTMVETRHF